MSSSSSSSSPSSSLLHRSFILIEKGNTSERNNHHLEAADSFSLASSYLQSYIVENAGDGDDYDDDDNNDISQLDDKIINNNKVVSSENHNDKQEKRKIWKLCHEQSILYRQRGKECFARLVELEAEKKEKKNLTKEERDFTKEERNRVQSDVRENQTQPPPLSPLLSSITSSSSSALSTYSSSLSCKNNNSNNDNLDNEYGINENDDIVSIKKENDEDEENDDDKIATSSFPSTNTNKGQQQQHQRQKEKIPTASPISLSLEERLALLQSDTLQKQSSLLLLRQKSDDVVDKLSEGGDKVNDDNDGTFLNTNNERENEYLVELGECEGSKQDEIHEVDNDNIIDDNDNVNHDNNNKINENIHVNNERRTTTKNSITKSLSLEERLKSLESSLRTSLPSPTSSSSSSSPPPSSSSSPPPPPSYAKLFHTNMDENISIDDIRRGVEKLGVILPSHHRPSSDGDNNANRWSESQITIPDSDDQVDELLSMVKDEFSIISESNIEVEEVDYADIHNNDDSKKKLETNTSDIKVGEYDEIKELLNKAGIRIDLSPYLNENNSNYKHNEENISNTNTHRHCQTESISKSESEVQSDSTAKSKHKPESETICTIVNTEVSPLHPVLETDSNNDGIKIQNHGHNKSSCICDVNDGIGKDSIVNSSGNNDEGEGINRNNDKVNNSDGNDANKNNNDDIIDNNNAHKFLEEERKKEDEKIRSFLLDNLMLVKSSLSRVSACLERNEVIKGSTYDTHDDEDCEIEKICNEVQDGSEERNEGEKGVMIDSDDRKRESKMNKNKLEINTREEIQRLLQLTKSQLDLIVRTVSNGNINGDSDINDKISMKIGHRSSSSITRRYN